MSVSSSRDLVIHTVYPPHFSRRLANSGAADATEAVNSTTYLDWFVTEFVHDWDLFPATHFMITASAFANASGQTISLQLAAFGTPTNAISAGGDDLVIPFNGGAKQTLNSGWVAVSDTMAGVDDLCVALKGSNSTVDLTYRWIDIAFKINVT